VPDPRLDVRAVTGAQHRSPAIAHDRQFALQNAGALMQRRVQMLTRAGKRGQLGDGAALSVLPWQNEDHGRSRGQAGILGDGDETTAWDETRERPGDLG
jgi:hypothetical protein